MKIGILSDTHIGKDLKTNTTQASRDLLKQSIFSTATHAVNLLQGTHIVHTADLFDKPHNDAESILQAATIANRCDTVIFGNHDARNRKDQVSSLELLRQLSPSGSKPLYCESNWSPNIVIDEVEDSRLVYVPHCCDQQVFEASLDLAYGKGGNVLFLHCNYDNELVTGKEQNLNLTEAKAEQLLEKFDFIVMGHEHQYASRLNGRVISVGTTHPTGFSDISDKFCLVIDTETLTVEKIQTWSRDAHLSISPDEFIEANPAMFMNYQFIDVVGSTDVANAHKVSDTSHAVWESSSNLIALRTSKVEYTSSSAKEARSVDKIETLPDVIRESLSGDILDLFNEAVSKFAD